MHVFVGVFFFFYTFLMQQTLINIQKILAREKHKKMIGIFLRVYIIKELDILFLGLFCHYINISSDGCFARVEVT